MNEKPVAGMDELHPRRRTRRRDNEGYADEPPLSGAIGRGDESGRPPPTLQRTAHTQQALRLGALAAVLVAALTTLVGCPIAYEEPRACVAWHECTMGCADQPCIAAWGCVAGECVPVPAAIGTNCTDEDGARGECFEGTCLVASYPISTVTVSPPMAQPIEARVDQHEIKGAP